ncbi:MAG TPA: MBL fold metallo-hydrolase [Patescibacteria group bacterium]|nr:MBL fold metallo-hydrolase [Patescibacteria group bacterium]
MKLTKYEHACVVLEEQGKKIVIDPGAFTQSFGELTNIVAVVVTHKHPDHFEPRHLDAIIAANPAVRIFAPSDVTDQFPDKPTTAVTGGDTADIAPFNLRFFGERHAEIHPDHFTMPENIGVMINDRVYNPGDSFVIPNVPVTTLLAPVSAPWLKIGETIDFVEHIKPNLCIATHTALLSEVAITLTEQNWLGAVCKEDGIIYKHLNPGDSIDVV